MNKKDQLESIAVFRTAVPAIFLLIVFPVLFELGYYFFSLCVMAITVYSFVVQHYAARFENLNAYRPYWKRINEAYPVIIFCLNLTTTAFWIEYRKWSFFSFIVIGTAYLIARYHIARKIIDWVDKQITVEDE